MSRNAWTPTPHSKPREGALVECIAPSGDSRRLIYEDGLWWLPDGSMYVYFTPTFWRNATEETA